MPGIAVSTVQAVFVMVGLIVVGLILKRKNIIGDSHRPLFGRLVTDFALPAMIFTGLAARAPRIEILLAVIVMILAIACHLVLSWAIGKYLHLGRRQMGAFMLVAAFGSSATLGYAMITQIFPGNTNAVTDAIMISELGVGIPLFFIGVMVAMYYGGKEGVSAWSSIRSYLASPIFIALVAGILASFFMSSIQDPAWDVILSVLDIMALSLPVFVTLGIALMLRWIPFKTVGVLACVTIILTLVLQPLVALFLSDLVHVAPIETDILVLETAMPSGMVAAVLSDRYGCDGELASVLVIATYLFSLVTMPLIMLLVP
jgi:predicted permease